MLLLEIGLWDILSQISNSKSFKDISPEVFKERIIDKRIPQLGVRMGSRYMEATRTCIRGDFGVDPTLRDTIEGGSALHSALKSQILNRLRSCVV